MYCAATVCRSNNFSPISGHFRSPDWRYIPYIWGLWWYVRHVRGYVSKICTYTCSTFRFGAWYLKWPLAQGQLVVAACVAWQAVANEWGGWRGTKWHWTCKIPKYGTNNWESDRRQLQYKQWPHKLWSNEQPSFVNCKQSQGTTGPSLLHNSPGTMAHARKEPTCQFEKRR